MRSIVEQAIEYYGEDNVNPVISRDGDIVELLEYGMDDKLIQILLCDDASLRGFTDVEIRKYFKARHLYKALSGNSNGYILTIFNVHRFHSLKTELRTNIDVAIWRTPPTNPYDNSIVKMFVGKEGIEDLSYVESLRMDNPEWNAVSVFTTRLQRGLLLLPMAEQNHIKELVKPSFKFNLGEIYTYGRT